MLKIKTHKGYVDFYGGFSVQIDEKSPIMNDQGSQSVPVTIPYTNNNALITGFAHRIDASEKPMHQKETCTVLDGVYKRAGKINIVSAGRNNGITLNIGFDNSEAYSAWKAKKLRSITLPTLGNGNVEELCTLLTRVLNGYPADFSIFQIVTSNPSRATNNVTTYYPQYLNYIYTDSASPVLGNTPYQLRYRERKEIFLINDTPKEITLPLGYGVTAFVYVWRVLELIFSEFGYTISQNPFKENKELARLVILNNTADSCVTGYLSYTDLMPDCTIDDFLNSLYVRFGLVYHTSSDTKTATLRLLVDILNSRPSISLTRFLSDSPLTTYEPPQQLKLSAKTSFSGSAPSLERFEDYMKENKNLVVRIIRFNPNIQVGWINYEETTGRWFKWDIENKELTYSSSSFFNWDRQTNSVQVNELSSDDECLPMDFAPNNILCPQYLADYVHRYTYIKSSSSTDTTDSEKEETPLSFAFAFVTPANSYYTFGSVLPISPEGGNVVLKDGSKHLISLLFQFTDGLFANFWKQYDAILRHSFNRVETKISIPVHQLMSLDVLSPISISGQPVLLDSYSYSLPASNLVTVDFTCRTLHLLKPYNLAKEQEILVFGKTVWVWSVSFSMLDDVVEERLQYWITYYRNEVGLVVYGARLTATKYEGYITPLTDEDILKNPPMLQDERKTKHYKCRIEIAVTVNDRSGAYVLSFFITDKCCL